MERINEIQVSDFKGIKNLKLNPKKLNVFTGSNGSGKSSILSAISYAITGKEPDNNIVRLGAERAATRILFADGKEFMRSKSDVNNVWFDKKKLNISTANTLMERQFDGVPISEIDLSLSAGKVFGMKPQELSDYLLSYVRGDIKKDMVKSLLPGADERTLKLIDKYLVEDTFDITEIDAALSRAKDDRKAIKARIKDLKAYTKVKPEKMAEEEKEEVEKELKKLADLEVKQNLYAASVKSYNDIINEIENKTNTIAEKKKRLSEIEIEEDLDAKVEKVSATITENKVNKNEAESVLTTLKQNLETSKKNLDRLNTPYCPLSEKLVCTADKTPIKNELEDSIRMTQNSIKTQEFFVAMFDSTIKNASEELKTLQSKMAELKEREMLTNEIKILEASVPKKPEKPEKIEIENIKDKRAVLTKKLTDYATVSAYENNIAELEEKENYLIAIESLIKAFDPKGVVKNTIMVNYRSTFEDVLNEAATTINKNYRAKAIIDNGMSILFSFGNDFIPYKDLSNGEKVMATYIMLTMIDKLVGTGILLIDELSVLDTASYKTLLSILKDDKQFNYIFVANTNNDDFIKVLNELGIEPIDINEINITSQNAA